MCRTWEAGRRPAAVRFVLRCCWWADSGSRGRRPGHCRHRARSAGWPRPRSGRPRSSWTGTGWQRRARRRAVRRAAREGRPSRLFYIKKWGILFRRGKFRRVGRSRYGSLRGEPRIEEGRAERRLRWRRRSVADDDGHAKEKRRTNWRSALVLHSAQFCASASPLHSTKNNTRALLPSPIKRQGCARENDLLPLPNLLPGRLPDSLWRERGR